MTSYGFTGTRRGMTDQQKAALEQLFKGCDIYHTHFHHGGCRGADVEAHLVAAFRAYRHVHPGDDLGQWANRGDYEELRSPKPFLVRNRIIVDVCDVLIAAPETLKEKLRSGTWSTIRYARKIGKPVIILDPGGTI